VARGNCQAELVCPRCGAFLEGSADGEHFAGGLHPAEHVQLSICLEAVQLIGGEAFDEFPYGRRILDKFEAFGREKLL
jgi:hypothetical protein